MNNIFNWFKTENIHPLTEKEQTLLDIKRSGVIVNFIHPGHPLYDNIVAKEENDLHILAPNETAYNETSLTHNFVAIVVYNNQNYLVINSFKHFKEQSIGGLLQFDENIYEVIPFFETEEEYKTASNYVIRETYEYDHPVESYAFIFEQNNKQTKLICERGKKPLNITMIDSLRSLFATKLTAPQTELIDCIVIPALKAYADRRQKRTSDAS